MHISTYGFWLTSLNCDITRVRDDKPILSHVMTPSWNVMDQKSSSGSVEKGAVINKMCVEDVELVFGIS